MKPTDDMFDSLMGQAGKSFVKILGSDSKNNNDDKETFILILALSGILAFVGSEIVKVIFRGNFGIGGINIVRVILSFICLLGISFVFFFAPNEEIGSTTSFMFFGGFYTLLAFYTLIKGIKVYQQSQKNKTMPPYFTGQSTLLSFLLVEGWKQKTLLNFIEPIIIICIGIGFTFINYVAGIPLFFCAISIWIYQIVEFVYGYSNFVNTTLATKGHSTQNNNGTRFTQVKN